MFRIGFVSNKGCPVMFHCVKATSFVLAFAQQLVILGCSSEYHLRVTLSTFFFNESQAQVCLPRQW